MKVIICKDYDHMSKVAADIVTKEVQNNPHAKLGLATGGTPKGMYENIIEDNKKGISDFSHVETVNLDEYIGLSTDNHQSYHYYMMDNLFDHININKDNIHIPVVGEDLEESVRRYNSLLDKVGTRDIQVLGIGENGHIAFNEPDDTLRIRTSVVELTQSTIEANSRYFDTKEEVPTKAVSMGIGDIFNAKHILVLASGKNKHEAVSKILDLKQIDTHFPVSLLALHPHVTLVVDEDAVNG